MSLLILIAHLLAREPELCAFVDGSPISHYTVHHYNDACVKRVWGTDFIPLKERSRMVTDCLEWTGTTWHCSALPELWWERKNP